VQRPNGERKVSTCGRPLNPRPPFRRFCPKLWQLWNGWATSTEKLDPHRWGEELHKKRDIVWRQSERGMATSTTESVPSPLSQLSVAFCFITLLAFFSHRLIMIRVAPFSCGSPFSPMHLKTFPLCTKPATLFQVTPRRLHSLVVLSVLWATLFIMPLLNCPEIPNSFPVLLPRMFIGFPWVLRQASDSPDPTPREADRPFSFFL